MGTITSRKRKDGTIGYTAQIRVKRGDHRHTESETFDRKSLAQEWMRRREAELDQQRARGEPIGKSPTLKVLIDWYIETIGKDAHWGRSKAADLERIKRSEIAKKHATQITAADYIAHAEARRDEGAGPATIGNDFVWIGQVLRSARPELGIMADLARLDDARVALRHRKLIAKSKWRDRRLRPEEETSLLNHFDHRDKRAKIPMGRIMRFALISARREDEITRILRDDLHRGQGTITLRDVKHPRRKQGNNKTFRLLDAGWSVIDEEPVASSYVFPYNPKSISSAFTRACKFLGITNLHFHDLRHEATSRLFEMGYSIQEVAQFTLHESWETLRRYTHLRPEQVLERASKSIPAD